MLEDIGQLEVVGFQITAAIAIMVVALEQIPALAPTAAHVQAPIPRIVIIREIVSKQPINTLAVVEPKI